MSRFNRIYMTSSYLKKPNVAKTISQKHLGRYLVTTCEMQGWRKTMEDAILCEQVSEGVYLLGVFDGHGGPEVSQYVASMLPKEIHNQPYFKLKNYPKALRNICRRLDQLIEGKRGEEALRSISQEQKQGKWQQGGKNVGQKAGTTAIIVLMTQQRYYVANVGDSRAVLSRAGKVVPLSTDHKPDLNSEKSRIEQAGGFVKNGRVNGSLSLSRSIGDFEFKTHPQKTSQEQMVSCQPEIREIEPQESDNFIFLGCDGVWEKYVRNSQKMVDHIFTLKQKHEDSQKVLQKLLNDLLAKEGKDIDGCDNMSCILLQIDRS